mmetsp:Transcript_89229/g.282333  ORF Transcript_89229/g.282333 Transcript_89229/m.282333 type:complete len:331 (-) Transcript_89229:1912-2904(-)
MEGRGRGRALPHGAGLAAQLQGPPERLRQDGLFLLPHTQQRPAHVRGLRHAPGGARGARGLCAEGARDRGQRLRAGEGRPLRAASAAVHRRQRGAEDGPVQPAGRLQPRQRVRHAPLRQRAALRGVGAARHQERHGLHAAVALPRRARLRQGAHEARGDVRARRGDVGPPDGQVRAAGPWQYRLRVQPCAHAARGAPVKPAGRGHLPRDRGQEPAEGEQPLQVQAAVYRAPGGGLLAPQRAGPAALLRAVRPRAGAHARVRPADEEGRARARQGAGPHAPGRPGQGRAGRLPRRGLGDAYRPRHGAAARGVREEQVGLPRAGALGASAGP